MKILMMSNTYIPIVGGLERSIQAFSEAFRKKGHEVVLVTPAHKDQPKEEKDVIRLPALQQWNGTDFAINIPLPGILSKLMSEFKPDIIHSHHPFLVGDQGLRLAGQYGIPIIFTYHTMYEQYLHYLPVNNDLIKNFIIQMSAGYANLVDCVIVPSESVKEILIKRRVHQPMEIIPTGMDLSRFEKGDGDAIRDQFNIPKDAFVVGHVGRLATEKNLTFLTECVSAFMQKEPRAHFLLIGDGPSKKEIETAFELEGLGDRVHATGVLENENLINGYFAMDIFAFSSLSETQGMVVAEAMAAHLPVVALDAPGIREVVRDGQNGRLIEAEDKKAFTEALSWIGQRKGPEFEALKKEARKTAEELSIEVCAEKLLNVYSRFKSHQLPDQKDNAFWSLVLGRFETEWDMLKNLTESTEKAVKMKFWEILSDMRE